MANRFQINVPKRRAADDPWFRVGNIDVTTTVFVIGLNVVSMFIYAFSRETVGRLAMFRVFVQEGQVWRLVTWPFASTPNFSTAISLLAFWFFGGDIERMFGRVRFAKFLAAIAVIVLLLALALNSALFGARLVGTAVFITYIAENPRRPFFFGIPAWILGCIFVGIEVLQLLGDSQPKEVLLLLAAIGTALILLRGYGWGSEVPWVPKVAIPPAFGGPTGRRPSVGRSADSTARGSGRAPKTRKPKTRKTGSDSSVVTGPWGERGTGTATTGAAPSTRLGSSGPVSAADVDRVLDKVAATGLASLTADEREILENASKSLRDRGTD